MPTAKTAVTLESLRRPLPKRQPPPKRFAGDCRNGGGLRNVAAAIARTAAAFGTVCARPAAELPFPRAERGRGSPPGARMDSLVMDQKKDTAFVAERGVLNRLNGASYGFCGAFELGTTREPPFFSSSTFRLGSGREVCEGRVMRASAPLRLEAA